MIYLKLNKSINKTFKHKSVDYSVHIIYDNKKIINNLFINV